MATVRALRKWMRHNAGLPADLVVWMRQAHVPRKPGQASMAKGVETVLLQILPELRARGVTVIAI